MHSISSLRQTLGLTTTNQVRNRIEAIKDLLLPHIRRGPNNQLLLTDGGLELLRRVQELSDSGLTIAEASDVVRSNTYQKDAIKEPVSFGFAAHKAKPSPDAACFTSLREELASLRRRVAYLEAHLTPQPRSAPDRDAWWSALREQIDAP